jgi:ABC-type uncharacterized transport system substrate-binding protein
VRIQHRFSPARAVRHGLLLLCLSVLPGALYAHPHAWIDLRVVLQIDSSQRLTAMSQRWAFDPLYSLLLTEDIPDAADPTAHAAALAEMRERLLTNIAGHGYLTDLEHGEAAVAGVDVRDATLSISDDGQLVLAFTLRSASPIDLAAASLRYRIYDPLFYIHMLHGDASAIELADASARCSASLTRARPSASAIARATAVDRGAADADGLGRHFAETVSVQCQ